MTTFSNLLSLLKRHAYIQLLLLILALFALPLVPAPFYLPLNRLFFYLIILVSAYLIDKHSKIYIRVSIALVTIKIIVDMLNLYWLEQVDDNLTVIFFMWISIRLIRQTIKGKISDDTILTAISGYLILALALSILMLVIVKYDPLAFTFMGKPFGPQEARFPFCSYYVFVTYTTLGYGDVLPVTTLSQTFAKLTATAGQIYLTINVAILVGKYLNQYKPNGTDQP